LRADDSDIDRSPYCRGLILDGYRWRNRIGSASEACDRCQHVPAARLRSGGHGSVRRHHLEGTVTDGDEVFACGGRGLIQLKKSSTAAANPTANIAPGW
jgi:hypothetical protein